MYVLKVEVTQKGKQLQAAQERVVNLTAKVESLRTQLDLIYYQLTKLVECDVKEEEEVALRK